MQTARAKVINPSQGFIKMTCDLKMIGVPNE